MTFELIYTSAERGLEPGSHGFCTVVSTKGVPRTLAMGMESLSGYRHLQLAGTSNPVVWSHVHLQLDGRAISVLSRVADYGQDDTGRSNKLAHHIAISTSEQTTARPTWLLRQPNFLSTSWDGRPRRLPAGRTIPGTTPPPPSACSAWKNESGDAGWAGVIAEELMSNSSRPVYVIISPAANALTLIDEVCALCPTDRMWDITFSSFYTRIPKNADCQLRFVIQGTPEATAAGQSSGLCIDLASPGKLQNESGYVRFARTGNVSNRPEISVDIRLTGSARKSRSRANRPTLMPTEPIYQTVSVPSAPALVPKTVTGSYQTMLISVVALALLIPMLSFGAYRVFTGESDFETEQPKLIVKSDKSSEPENSGIEGLDPGDAPKDKDTIAETKATAAELDQIIKNLAEDPEKAKSDLRKLKEDISSKDNAELVERIESEQQFATAVLDSANAISEIPNSFEQMQKLDTGLLTALERGATHLENIATGLRPFIDAENPHRAWLDQTVASLDRLGQSLRPLKDKSEKPELTTDCVVIAKAMEKVSNWHQQAVEQLAIQPPMVLYLASDGRRLKDAVVAELSEEQREGVNRLGELAHETRMLTTDTTSHYELETEDDGVALREANLPDTIGVFSFDKDYFFEVRAGKLPDEIGNNCGALFTSRYGRLFLFFGPVPETLTSNALLKGGTSQLSVKNVFQEVAIRLDTDIFELNKGGSQAEFAPGLIAKINKTLGTGELVTAGHIRLSQNRAVLELTPKPSDLEKQAELWSRTVQADGPFGTNRPDDLIKKLRSTDEAIATTQTAIDKFSSIEEPLPLQTKRLKEFRLLLRRLMAVKKHYDTPRHHAASMKAVLANLKVRGTIGLRLRDKEANIAVDVEVFRVVDP